nr:MAG TPA: General transcription factor IIE subunit transcription factor, RNA Polymerase.1A [Caudoviricetes sp.]
MVTNEKIKLRSRINQYFTPELQRELEEMIFYEYGRDNNSKAKEIYNIIRRVNPAANAVAIGPGTNRYAVLIDGYVFKVALDKDGVIDNMKEFSLSKTLSPDVIKVYELSSNGMLMSCEYIRVLDWSTYTKSQSEIRKILAHIVSLGYFIGDVGVSSKNYLNWGTRPDGSLCILDFAYIYKVSYKVFTCSCDPMSKMIPDANFNNLVCPLCKRVYTFSDIRSRMSSNDILREIGDLTKKAYIIHGKSETVYRDTDLSERSGDDKLIKKLKQKREMAANTNYDNDMMDIDAFLDKVSKGEETL